jgi:hypothetical protein
MLMAVANQEKTRADAEAILNRLERVVRWSDSFTLASSMQLAGTP